ncbi:hypothetical protein P3W85_14615 [Cupriavidus basilensis]|uniref:Multicopper oxidase domain-containing protein n=1 Tax=Cupriavidus basilensis TaxID=68895 RepID=A0ABT6ANI0_9BURK|nr:hypothetical protein [Cupriavidus basilensis]MDF3834179.1 hypothetical protein [Cupriavidus basilensis]
MKNPEIFNSYDMVVSLPLKTINDQLTHLTKMGVIHSDLVLSQSENDAGDYTYSIFNNPNDIPLGPDGTPAEACIIGQIIPQVKMAASGTNITFVINFREGSAYFWHGHGPAAKLKKYDMSGWKYGINITLDLQAVEKEDLAKNIGVPDLVKNQLYHFMSNMFTVNSLFMDFESTDLMRFDPVHTSTGEAGDDGMEQMVLFMNFYLKDLVAKGNPYILGYSLDTNDHTNYDPDQNVPDALRPVGTTFIVYHDPNYPDLSNLNFVLATKGGHGGITGSPGNFDTNWIQPDEQCDAKMVYSHSCLVEKYIVRPVFDQIRDGVYNKIHNDISISKNQTYDVARSTTSDGLSFLISDVSAGDNQYVNNMAVKYSIDGTTARIAFSGYIGVYKGVDRDMGVCTAAAHAAGHLNWAATVSLVTVKNDKGEPTLQMTVSPVQTSNTYSDSGKNTCADIFEWIGKIIGTILDALTLFLDGNFFSNLFDDLLNLHIPGIGNFTDCLGNLTNSVSTVLVLPAGQVFFFKTPGIDNEGNLSMQLTYKAEN